MFTIMSYNNTDSKFCTDTLINLGYKFKKGYPANPQTETVVFSGMDTQTLLIDSLTLANDLNVPVIFVNAKLSCLQMKRNGDDYDVDKLGYMKQVDFNTANQHPKGYKFDGMCFVID